jgi:hypothetical protein
LYQFGTSATAAENWHIGSEGDGSFRFYNQVIGAGVERLRITSAGLVGIGTSSPGARLHVGSNASSGNWSGFFGDNLNGAVAPPAAYGLAFGYNRSGGSGEANIAYGTGTGAGLGLIFGSYDGTTYTNRVIFDGAGNVGIGTASPGNTLDISPGSAGEALRIRGGTGGTSIVQFTDNTASAQWGTITTTSASAALTHSSVVRFLTASSERARIDPSGRLLIGTSTYSGSGAGFEIEGTGSFGPQIRATAKGSDNYPVYQVFRKSRGASIVQNNDFIFECKAEGFDGSTFVPAAAIRADVDGTPGANDMPGRIVLSTTASGASSPTERMRIASNGSIFFAATSESSITSGAANGKFINSFAEMYSSRATTGAASHILFYQSKRYMLVRFLQLRRQLAIQHPPTTASRKTS